jgi:hypothetical protein
MQSVIMLSVIMPSAIILSVIMPNGTMLRLVMPSVLTLNVIILKAAALPDLPVFSQWPTMKPSLA